MSTRPDRHGSWCKRCGSRHARGACPGPLIATGPERHGWRCLAMTTRGPEVYGTLVAPTERLWRARVLTYPNVLWVAPGAGPIKFAGATPTEAEDQAIEFIRWHCRVRRHELRREIPAVECAPIDQEAASGAASREARAIERRPSALPVRFGTGRPTTEATTDDLSEKGLFIRTEAPLDVGTAVNIFLQAGGLGITLKGVVRWSRQRDANGRPRGMGLQLEDPHPCYLRYVRGRWNRPADDEPVTHEVDEVAAADSTA